MKWMAIDIGGANLKAADGEGFAESQPFPLWQQPRRLAEALRALLAMVPRVDHVAATMTGELADCFTTKTEGVHAILEAISVAADARHTRIYLTDGTLVSPQVARKKPLMAAASNWHALAKFCGRYARHGSAVLVDIGSTTCDIIPLIDGKPVTLGRTDPARLASGELVYTGVERSPVCAVVGAIPWRGKKYPVAHELFATTWDAYLTLGDLLEEPHSTHTADRKPATKAAARDRLARTICADRDMFSAADAEAAARHIAQAQLVRLTKTLTRVLARLAGRVETAVISGRGEFLCRRMFEALQLAPRLVSLSHELGTNLSRCATAHALAVLAREGSS